MATEAVHVEHIIESGFSSESPHNLCENNGKSLKGSEPEFVDSKGSRHSVNYHIGSSNHFADLLSISISESSLCDPEESDMPPLPLDYPRSDSDALKLQKRRIYNERVRLALISEQEAFDCLLKEEEVLIKKANKTTDMIHNLVSKAEQLDQRYKSVDELYRTNQEKLKLLEQAVDGINKQWQQEATEINSHSGRLQKLRAQKSKLDIELVDAAGQCTALSAKLAASLQEKERLRDILAKITNENDSSKAQINFADKEVQTQFSFTVLDDIENIHLELEKQRTTMKNVREAIELIKRCT